MFNDKDGFEILSFANKDEMYKWMVDHHASTPAIWLRMFKKATGIPTVFWADAVEVCLCFGWIDGVANKYDDVSHIQRLTPRRPKGTWSKKNVETVSRLIEAGLMTPAGQAQVDAAKADGRWDIAYASPANMTVPEDFQRAANEDITASERFKALNKASLYTIGYQLTTAKKPETRQRRFDLLLAKLKDGRSI